MPKHKHIYGNRRAFTIIELLVVITICFMLAAILLPAIQIVRASARKMTCSSNMKQLGIAVHLFSDVNSVLPPSKFYYRWDARTSSGKTKNESVGHSLVPFLLPYIEQQSIYSLYHFEENWQNNINDPATENHIPVLLCPDVRPVRFCRFGPTRTVASHNRIVEYYSCDYAHCDYIAGKAITKMKIGLKGEIQGGVLEPAVLETPGDKTEPGKRKNDYLLTLSGILTINPVDIASITDGLSSTILLCESVGRPLKFELNGNEGDGEINPKTPMKGGRWANEEQQIWVHDLCNGSQIFSCNNDRDIYSLHTGGSNFLYGDGSVNFHSTSMSAPAFVGRFTTNAGDATP